MKKLYAVGFNNNKRCPSQLGAVLVLKRNHDGILNTREEILGVEPIVNSSEGFSPCFQDSDVLFYTSSLAEVSEAIAISKKLRANIESIEATIQIEISKSARELEKFNGLVE